MAERKRKRKGTAGDSAYVVPREERPNLLDNARVYALKGLARLKELEAEKLRNGELTVIRVDGCAIAATPERMKEIKRHFKIKE